MNQFIGRPRALFLFLHTLLLTGSCAVVVCNAYPSEISGERKEGENYLLLSLIGYNYTDRHISEYSVEGASGGYVRLSSHTGGGSGTTCCIKIQRNYRDRMTVKVRWQVDGCTYLIKDSRTGKADKARYLHYKEAEVEVLRKDGGNPEYIETHFYPDGSVQVQLTESMSHPFLVLDHTRRDKSQFPRCKNDKNPEE